MPSSIATVGILDLSGYTAFTRANGDIAALKTALYLYEFTNRYLEEGVRVVKTLGDGLLMAAEREGAVETSIERIRSMWDGALALKTCASRGEVVHHEADIFGDLVNTLAHQIG